MRWQLSAAVGDGAFSIVHRGEVAVVTQVPRGGDANPESRVRRYLRRPPCRATSGTGFDSPGLPPPGVLAVAGRRVGVGSGW